MAPSMSQPRVCPRTRRRPSLGAKLPPELMFEIFKYLPTCSLARFRKVSRGYQALVEENRTYLAGRITRCELTRIHLRCSLINLAGVDPVRAIWRCVLATGYLPAYLRSCSMCRQGSLFDPRFLACRADWLIDNRFIDTYTAHNFGYDELMRLGWRRWLSVYGVIFFILNLNDWCLARNNPHWDEQSGYAIPINPFRRDRLWDNALLEALREREDRKYDTLIRVFKNDFFPGLLDLSLIYAFETVVRRPTMEKLQPRPPQNKEPDGRMVPEALLPRIGVDPILAEYSHRGRELIHPRFDAMSDFGQRLMALMSTPGCHTDIFQQPAMLEEIEVNFW